MSQIILRCCRSRALRCLIIAFILTVTSTSPAVAEDGYELWLRFRPVEASAAARYAPHLTSIVAGTPSPTATVAVTELRRGVAAMIGRAPTSAARPHEGSVVVGTPRSSAIIARLALPLEELGSEGYCIRSMTIDGRRVLVIAANKDVGVLYGVFALLRRVQTRQSIDGLDLRERPAMPLRLLNHWDNLDRTVERGYSGSSLWDWHKLPGYKDPRYTDYARANASIGINATVLTNVNANAQVLTPHYLAKVAALADLFRPWGIRVFLTARFSAPIEIGGLKTADPLDPDVKRFWREKADQIYRSIPDFGGLLVKANSEGQPGPQDYGRSHTDGANMLADALAPHGGVVMWRAFVYTANPKEDRAKQAYSEFRPLDGAFRKNVILQVKNGPIDFQPREPFHPLFGQMRTTPTIMEAQITKEYLGFATHLAFLAPLWKEVLDARAEGGSSKATVASIVARNGGLAGVANIGTDRNWSGSHFDQANWFAFGRLAWDPTLSSRAIADEWARMTWGPNRAVVDPIVAMMMESREAVVDYMTPLGLHHLMASDHHYGPGPWVDDLERPDWNPVYYHRADEGGIGFDRTASGSNAIAQYAPHVARAFADTATVPENLLLWFHRVPWDFPMRSGRPLWDELIGRYDRGVATVSGFRRTWESLRGRVDADRHAQVEAFLAIQESEARWWRDASIAYWLSVAKRPLPAGVVPPAHDVSWYRSRRDQFVPGH